jgi:hypothetical protein
LDGTHCTKRPRQRHCRFDIVHKYGQPFFSAPQQQRDKDDQALVKDVLSSLIETVESKARRHKLIEVTKQDVRARHVAKSVGSRKRKRNSSGRKLKLGQMWL